MPEVPTAISGKVAEVVDRYTLLINRGEEQGVRVGMIFVVMGLGGEVKDPDTGDPLGPKPFEKLRVKVSEVYPKFSVAETYRIVTPPSLNDLMTYRHESALANISLQAKPEREYIEGGDDPRDAKPTSAVVSVRIGDPVRQLMRS
jgi:hypothetical protein